ncbi:MFS transporter [Bradyrhizobium septentrionale]|uniref:MFS transporter n=1 Tax=Bradyrhizobium septentrionale TaxID=1404411 RepID=UPI001596CF0B|nr:MFS transporter [Bradyrhizobium septentrionale]UGY28494.1 MFS transporter [Bradyrhizobium septentrionale]
MHDRSSQVAPHRPSLITSVLGLGVFLIPFDVTAVVVALPGIAGDLGFAAAGAAWVIDAYSLALTGALLASGALADRFGRRCAMLAGNIVFLLGSIACGAATSGPLLLAARALQGIGAAFLITGAIALVAGAFPHQSQRARVFGTIGVISGVAMALGPTLGGLLAAWCGWRWIFLANIPFCLTLALAVPRLITETNEPGGRPLDPVGIVLLTLALGLAIDALLRHDASPIMRATGLIAGVATAFGFVRQQWRCLNPVLNPRVFATAPMIGVGASLTALQFGYWATLVYLPLFLSTGLHVSMEVAGVALLAATLPMLLVPLLGGRFVTRWGWRRFFMAALGVVASGDALLVVAALSADATMRSIATSAGMLTIGIGAALANPQLGNVALALAPPAQAGMASAMTMIVRQAGFAVSIAALGAMLKTTDMASAFAAPFILAAVGAIAGVVGAATLFPAAQTEMSESRAEQR